MWMMQGACAKRELCEVNLYSLPTPAEKWHDGWLVSCCLFWLPPHLPSDERKYCNLVKRKGDGYLFKCYL